MEVKPCNGEGAVLDPETGEELDCGSGPKRKDCPLDSYCHQTPHFARCCPKGEKKFRWYFTRVKIKEVNLTKIQSFN